MSLLTALTVAEFVLQIQHHKDCLVERKLDLYKYTHSLDVSVTLGFISFGNGCQCWLPS